MNSFLERIGLFARAPDARPVAEIRADIDAELAFHVDESARELGESGLTTDEARAEALRRFGDLGQIRRECARTQLGERIVLQRIQVVLTVVLLVAVAMLFMWNRASSAQAAAERAHNQALLARLEAEIASRTAMSAALDRGALPFPLVPTGGVENYLTPDGALATFDQSSDAWLALFLQNRESWRHGLRIAERLAALPDAQGPEILAKIWSGLPFEHREQVMKPFVFDGGHPHALEVLALGFEDNSSSVKERAVLYLHTYAWKNLWAGEGTGSAWFAQYRDRPVAEVLRENAALWARDYGGMASEHLVLLDDYVGRFLEASENVRPETFAKAGVDLAAILKESGVCAVGPEQVRRLSPKNRALAERVLTWCKP